jgi:CrcB protein
VGIGVLGGYTTFSTYSADLVALLTGGQPGMGLGYLVVTPVASVTAAWLGGALTRAFASMVRRRRTL